VGLQVVSAGRAAAVTAAGDQLAAGLQALNTTLPDASASYDQIANALATSVNAQHSAGVAADGTTTGVPLFTTNDGSTPFTAAHLALGVSTPAGLAAATAGQGATDGSNADAISQLQNAADGPNALWKRYVADLGTRSASAATRATTATAALQSATSDQQSVSGVSIDEETANLLVLQRAYQGAARVMTAVDEALDTLINKTGLVGR
jgi:flagellar hook-associated protein 1